MIPLEKIKIEPITLCKKQNGKICIISGHHRVNTLKILGINEITSKMYILTDGSLSREIVKLSDIED